jgi:hypothetical protein
LEEEVGKPFEKIPFGPEVWEGMVISQISFPVLAWTPVVQHHLTISEGSREAIHEAMVVTRGGFSP